MIILKKSEPASKGNLVERINYCIYRVSGLVVIFAVTCFVIWFPWALRVENGHYTSKLDVDQILIVVRRIFPLQRGLFEDKVANIWCVLHYTHIFVVKKYLDESYHSLMCIAATLLGSSPAIYFLTKRASKKQFLMATFSVTMAFYLLGFQVHEK